MSLNLKISIIGIMIILLIISYVLISNSKQRRFLNYVWTGNGATGSQIQNEAITNQQFLQQFQNEWVNWEAIYSMSQEEKDKLLWEIDHGIYVNVPIL